MFHLTVGEETELRLFEERQADDLFACIERNRAYLRRWLPWLDENTRIDHTRAFIRASLEQRAAGNGFSCGLWHEGRLVGSIGLHFVDRPNRKTSLGYWLDEAHQGRGLMTAACTTLLSHVFGELDLHRAEIACAPGNTRSAAIPERLGFVGEGRLRQCEWLYDHYVDHVVYGLLAPDWRRREKTGSAGGVIGGRQG